VSSKYENLSKGELIRLLETRDRSKKFGLVWERNEIEADNAIDENFIACDIIHDLCEKPAPWRNLVIEGDNYDALRWLRMTYAGRVKCIYIDPPYNTGNKDWVYNDHYFDKEDRYRHSTWLEFLYRRLTLARDLLSDEGVMLVSINDENRAKLEMLMDEALPGMRLGSLVWRTRTGAGEGGPAFYSTNHEHILVYSKYGFRFSGSAKSFDKYSNPDDDPRGPWQKDNLTQSKTHKERPNSYFPIMDPSTNTYYPCNPDAVWRFVSGKKINDPKRIKTRTMEDLIESKQIIFPENSRVEVWHLKMKF